MSVFVYRLGCSWIRLRLDFGANLNQLAADIPRNVSRGQITPGSVRQKKSRCCWRTYYSSSNQQRICEVLDLIAHIDILTSLIQRSRLNIQFGRDVYSPSHLPSFPQASQQTVLCLLVQFLDGDQYVSPVEKGHSVM